MVNIRNVETFKSKTFRLPSVNFFICHQNKAITTNEKNEHYFLTLITAG